MSKKIYKTLSLLLCLLLLLQQTCLPAGRQAFAQLAPSPVEGAAVELNIAGHLSAMHNSLTVDKFRPLHLRYLSYDALSDNFKVLLDKGDAVPHPSSLVPRSEAKFQSEVKQLMQYFLIGLTLPNDTFWVNLRPDSPDNIIDDELAKTDIGRIMLETDLQLKKDTARYTSPDTPEGKLYWDKLYKKAGDLFGSENITIPTLTRPWIVPGEIIIRETRDEGRGTNTAPSAYIYKATLKVMLEEDYLKESNGRGLNLPYRFDDPRLKTLNEYSSQLIRELIIPKLTKEVNSSKRYASLRQVYYSLILAQWFKARFSQQSLRGGRQKAADEAISPRINSLNLSGLTSKAPWLKTNCFQQYQKSFAEGEYNIKEPVYTPTGQVVRSYFSGGMKFDLGQIAPFGSVPSSGSPIVAIAGGNKLARPLNRNLIEINSSSLVKATSASSAMGEDERGRPPNFTKEKIDGSVVYLHEVESMPTEEKIRYSRLKLGDSNAIEEFAGQILVKISEEVGVQISAHPEDWVLVGGPSSEPKNCMHYFCNILVNRLGIAKATINRKRYERPVLYTQSSLEVKREIVQETLYFDGSVPVKGKNVIFVDDCFVSGTICAISRKILLENGAKSVRAYTITRINSPIPELELDRTAVTEGGIEEVLRILKEPRNAVTSRLITILSLLAEEDIEYLVKNLNKQKIKGLAEAIVVYYGSVRYPRSLSALCASSALGGIDLSLRSGSIPPATGKAGGIDFRSLPIVIQAISNLSATFRDSPLRGQSLLRVNLNQEWRRIENMAERGIAPSPERIKEYIQASCLKDELNDTQKVISCIADILRDEEEDCSPTDPTLKDILVVLESGRPAQELKAIFSGS
ncbi:MAG: phosphoribosyltransferase [Candidatus Omnitrophota bacterium]